jgi:cytosine/adenosine deaminase-related metal-dependent hydrolase
LGNVAVLPGFVNAHAHLDLSGLRGRPLPVENFTAWLRAVIAYRRSASPEQLERDVQSGIAESVAHGITLTGDISSQGLSWRLLAEAPLRSVVFYELLGLPRQRARQAWRDARAWLVAHAATPTCRPGLSPHAPYSVRASLFRAAARLAHRRSLPLAVHLAESREEIELLARRAGPFVPFLQELGVWDAGGLVRTPDEVVRACATAANALFVHGNYLDEADRVGPGESVVYCPRTHAAFGHAPHPFRALLRAGVRVALGTDSLGSSPTLDVLAEARFLHRCFPDVSGAVVLRMATLAGAEALGWQAIAGSLEAGKSADLAVVGLPERAGGDAHQLVLNSALPVRAVLFRGRWVYGADALPAAVPPLETGPKSP